MVKDLIDSEDLKHTLFCGKAAFAAMYVLFQELYFQPLMVVQIY